MTESWLKIRMEPEIVDRIKSLVGDENTGGRAGGVSLLVRALVYPKIGLPFPSQRWRNEFNVPKIDELEESIRNWWRFATTVPAAGESHEHPSRSQLEGAFKESLALAKSFFQSGDLINLCRAEHLVSRGALLRSFYNEWKG